MTHCLQSHSVCIFLGGRFLLNRRLKINNCIPNLLFPISWTNSSFFSLFTTHHLRLPLWSVAQLRNIIKLPVNFFLSAVPTTVVGVVFSFFSVTFTSALSLVVVVVDVEGCHSFCGYKSQFGSVHDLLPVPEWTDRDGFALRYTLIRLYRLEVPLNGPSHEKDTLRWDMLQKEACASNHRKHSILLSMKDSMATGNN